MLLVVIVLIAAAGVLWALAELQRAGSSGDGDVWYVLAASSGIGALLVAVAALLV